MASTNHNAHPIGTERPGTDTPLCSEFKGR